MTPNDTTVLFGLGSNLGDPRAQLERAVARLRARFAPLEVSPVYRTDPVGHREQPDFYNLVCRGRTGEPPEAVLEAIRALEAEQGRERGVPNGPRTLDVDLLAYGGLVSESPELVLPHPRMHERAFVLVPLATLAPGWRHPVLGRTAAELLRELPWGQGVEPAGDLGRGPEDH